VLASKNSLVLDLNKSNPFATPLGNVKTETPAEWLLDSGASMHFTNDINDFIDYQVIKPIKVVTANISTQVTGKGAVILTVGDKAIQIEPVYHIPDLTTKLISLGKFLHNSLHTRGSNRSISVTVTYVTRYRITQHFSHVSHITSCMTHHES
jgi:hypothetical protein